MSKKKSKPSSPKKTKSISSNYQNNWLVPIGIFIFTFLLYANTIYHGFVLDDDAINSGWKLENNSLIRIWTTDTERHGVTRKAGDKRLTWEAMRAPVKSFSIQMNEKYQNAASQIKVLEQRHLTREAEALKVVEKDQQS